MDDPNRPSFQSFSRGRWPLNIIMRNIKISFEHPSYLYPFKLNLTSPSVADFDRHSCRQAEQRLAQLQTQLILSPEEEKVLFSLSTLFKAEFVSQYSARLNQRKQFDFLGGTAREHYEYFLQLCKERVALKEMLELRHYILRLPRMKNQGEILWQQWVQLVILFHTNFTMGQKIVAEREAVHQQLQAFVALVVMVESINQLVVNDRSFAMPMRSMLPAIQDSITQGYPTLTNILLQQQALLLILSLARTLIQYLRERLTIDEHNPEQDPPGGKKTSPSLIYWVINFVPQAKPQSKYEMLFTSFNAHTLLEIMAKFLPKTVNLLVIEDCLSFLNALFQQASGFGQLLFLITEAIRFEMPKTFGILSARIKTRELKSSHMMRYSLQCDLAQLLGRSTVQPFKLKQMIKITKSVEKAFNVALREANRMILALVEDFQRYKKGKIAFRRRKEVGGVMQEQIQERQILNIEKLAEESHLHFKSQEILSMQLFRENQELIKVNRWLQEKLKQTQAVLAELVTLNQKENARAKLALKTQVHSITFEPSPTVNFSQVVQYGNGERSVNEWHMKRTDSQEMLEGRGLRDSGKGYRDSKGYRQSRQEHPNRKSFPKYTLPPNSGDNILLEIPRIDIPRERQMRNSFNSMKQIEMSQTSLIFHDATNKINKSIEEAGNHQASLLPPPPPPPPSFHILPPIPGQIPGLLPPPLLLPPPPPPPIGLLNLSLPPLLPPPFLLPPPPLGTPFQPLPSQQQRLQMKNLGWNTLQHSKIKNSFWQAIEQPQVDINQDQLVKFFSKNEKNFVPNKPLIPQVRTILKTDRIKNVEIVMKKMKITDQMFLMIEDAFRSYTHHFLQEEFLSGLLNLVPTSKQRGEYMEITLQGNNWTAADRFLAFLSRIDSLQDKIQAVLFKEEFQKISIDFFGKVQDFINFFQELKKDRFFHAFLEYLLAVGNFLNLGTHRGNARAFRIQNIEKTYLLLAQDKQTSLFEYVLNIMYQQDPSLFDQPSLTNRSSVVPLSVLCEDYTYFQKRCGIVSQCVLLSEQDPLDESAPYFLPFYLKAREDVSVMKNQLEFASVLFKSVKEFYGDKLQSEEMAKLMVEFRNRVGQWRSKQKTRQK